MANQKQTSSRVNVKIHWSIDQFERVLFLSYAFKLVIEDLFTPGFFFSLSCSVFYDYYFIINVEVVVFFIIQVFREKSSCQ